MSCFIVVMVTDKRLSLVGNRNRSVTDSNHTRIELAYKSPTQRGLSAGHLIKSLSLDSSVSLIYRYASGSLERD